MLAPQERARLLDLLMESMSTTEDNAPPGATWDEVKRRIEEITNGAETIPAEEVFAKAREKKG